MLRYGAVILTRSVPVHLGDRPWGFRIRQIEGNNFRNQHTKR